jgi:small subunit ribosomal protein S20
LTDAQLGAKYTHVNNQHGVFPGFIWRINTLANHKSAIKRNKQNEKRAARNRHIRSTMRTLVKQVREAVSKGDAETAKTALEKAVPYIDKSATKGIIHKATASRKISRLSKLVNSLA